jgi:hypothetical protein
VPLLLSLRNLHRFLTNQSFYPILLSSLFAVACMLPGSLQRLLAYLSKFGGTGPGLVLYAFSMLAAGLFLTFPRQWWMMILLPQCGSLFPQRTLYHHRFLSPAVRPGVPFGMMCFSWRLSPGRVCSCYCISSNDANYHRCVLGKMQAGFCVLALSKQAWHLFRSFWTLEQLGPAVESNSHHAEVTGSLLEPLENLRFSDSPYYSQLSC